MIKPFDLSLLLPKAIGFSNGVARGSKDELLAVAIETSHEDAIISQTEHPSIFEMNMIDFFNYCDGNLYLFDVIKRHPSLKIVGFLESDNEVNVLYSESGCPFVTNAFFAGHCDPKSWSSWQWEHKPTENINIRFESIQSGEPIHVYYKFPFYKQWHDSNYYYPDAV